MKDKVGQSNGTLPKFPFQELQIHSAVIRHYKKL